MNSKLSGNAKFHTIKYRSQRIANFQLSIANKKGNKILDFEC